jgi:hypothetical protein
MSRMKADGTIDGRCTKMSAPQRAEQTRRAALYARQMETPEGESAIDPQTGNLREGQVGIMYEPFQWGLVDLKAVATLVGG